MKGKAYVDIPEESLSERWDVRTSCTQGHMPLTIVRRSEVIEFQLPSRSLKECVVDFWNTKTTHGCTCCSAHFRLCSLAPFTSGQEERTDLGTWNKSLGPAGPAFPGSYEKASTGFGMAACVHRCDVDGGEAFGVGARIACRLQFSSALLETLPAACL